MSLAAAAKAAPTRTPTPQGTGCKIGRLATQLPKAEARALQVLLTNMPATALRITLREETGLLVSASTIKDHRGGRCACY